MHPAILYQWKRARERGEGCRTSCGGPGRQGSERSSDKFEASHDRSDGPLFGVRRPLRFMAHKLDLDETQVKALARILNDLKTERAQAAVDEQRSVAQIAEALEGSAFGDDTAKAALSLRVKSAERLKEAVHAALERTHAILDEEQRTKLAYLLRSGALTI